VFLYNIIRFFFGVSIPAERHFLFLAWTVPTVLVGTAVWMYHQQKVKEESESSADERQSSRRVYLYLMSFIGLATLVTGLAFLLDVFTGLIVNASAAGSTLVSGDWWRSELSVAIALILVGCPVWLSYWRQATGLAGEGGATERGATSRRVYLYAVLGIAIIAAIADLVLLVYELVSGAMEGQSARDLLDSLTWLAQLVVVMVPVLLYHRRVLREDQEMGAERAGQKKRVTLLAGENGRELAERLGEKLGWKVKLLRLAGESDDVFPVPVDEVLDGAAGEIRESSAGRVLVVYTGGKVSVLGYEE
jgi:hypothetical protein